MVSGKQVLVDNPFIVTPNRANHFSANFRLASRPYALSKAVASSSRTQFAVVQHSAASTKTAYLRKCVFYMESVSVAGLYVVELHRAISAAATGNPAITCVQHRIGNVVECTALALPTTPANELGAAGVYASREFNLGITGAAPTTNPPAPLTEVVLFEHQGEGEEPLTLRPGIAEGWAVTVDSSATATVKCFVRMEFWEE